MVRHLVFVLLVGGCAVRSTVTPPPQDPWAPTPEQKEYAKAHPAEEQEFVAESPLLPATPKPIDEAKCQTKRDRVAEIGHELVDARDQREAYAREHCTGTLKREVWVVGHGIAEGPPTQVWLCDGKIVDTKVSNREAVLGTQRGLLLHDMKELGCMHAP